jgi:hypothetical protein
MEGKGPTEAHRLARKNGVRFYTFLSLLNINDVGSQLLYSPDTAAILAYGHGS